MTTPPVRALWVRHWLAKMVMKLVLQKTSILAGSFVGHKAGLARGGAVNSGAQALNAGHQEEVRELTATPCMRNMDATRFSTLNTAEVYIFCIPEPGRSVSDVSWYW